MVRCMTLQKQRRKVNFIRSLQWGRRHSACFFTLPFFRFYTTVSGGQNQPSSTVRGYEKNTLTDIGRKTARPMRCRHLPLRRQRRSARQQNIERRAASPPALGNYRYLPAGTQSASEQGDMLEKPAGENRAAQRRPGTAHQNKGADAGEGKDTRFKDEGIAKEKNAFKTAIG